MPTLLLFGFVRQLQLIRLDLAAFLRERISGLRESRDLELGTLAISDAEAASIAQEERDRTSSNWLKRSLRNYPFWISGHRRVFEIACRSKNHQLSYSSALAMQLLARTASTKQQADYLVAKSVLLSGDSTRALPLLKAASDATSRLEVKEDLAACYFALGQLHEAYDILHSVNDGELSASAIEVKLFLKAKLFAQPKSS